MARGSAPRLTLAAAAAALRWASPSRSSVHKLGVTPRVCAHRCPTLCERVETRTASEIPSQTPVSRTETRTAETQTETRTASETRVSCLSAGPGAHHPAKDTKHTAPSFSWGRGTRKPLNEVVRDEACGRAEQSRARASAPGFTDCDAASLRSRSLTYQDPVPTAWTPKPKLSGHTHQGARDAAPPGL